MTPSRALLGFVILFLLSCTKLENSKTDASPDTTAKNQTKTGTIHIVEIRQMKFIPDTIRVHKGDSVRWINKDMVDHDVTEVTKVWTSRPLKQGHSWMLAPLESADYYCNLHQVMKGRIIVEK